MRALSTITDQGRSQSGVGGNRTLHLTSCKTNISDIQVAQTHENSQHINTLPEAALSIPERNSTVLAYLEDTSMHPKGVTYVQQHQPKFPDDLAEVMDSWEKLPDVVKAGILAMVHATCQK